MTPSNTPIEYASLHQWLSKATIDRPSPKPVSRTRPIARMTPTRRLEKLHRLRTALEPPRSWLSKK